LQQRRLERAHRHGGHDPLRHLETVARARRIAIGFDDPVAHVRAFGERIPGTRPSLLLDHLARRRSEIDAINGAIAPAAAAVGLSAPVNAVVSALVRAKERDFA
jgi:2-dehydropantoate 2-reductase